MPATCTTSSPPKSRLSMQKRELPKRQSPPPHDLAWRDRKSTRLNSSHANISYAVFCLKKNTTIKVRHSVRILRPPAASLHLSTPPLSSDRPLSMLSMTSSPCSFILNVALSLNTQTYIY